MRKYGLNSKKYFLIPFLLLTLSLASITYIVPVRRAFAETPEEKAKKEADQKAAEAVKKLAENHKKAEENINYKFDRFKQTTLVSASKEKVRSMSEIMSMMGDLYLIPDVTVAGEVKKETNPAAAPDKVSLYFWAYAEKRNTLLYPKSKELNFLVDGKPLGPYVVAYKLTREGSQYVESMFVDLPYADFSKISNAQQSMEGRMGEVEFKFNDYQKILYQTFLKRISPAAK